MMKKLFLFTLLVSSFLVISCNNKDKTGSTEEKPIGTGIDSKYANTYEGTEVYPLDPTQSVTMILTVNANGGGSILVKFSNSTGDDKPIEFLPEQVDKYSDTKYKLKNGSFEFNFRNDGGAVDVSSEGNVITLNKKQQ